MINKREKLIQLKQKEEKVVRNKGKRVEGFYNCRGTSSIISDKYEPLLTKRGEG